MADRADNAIGVCAQAEAVSPPCEVPLRIYKVLLEDAGIFVALNHIAGAPA